MDTITAIATPTGTGGISVIRISGEKTFDIISDIFFSDKNDKNKLSINEINSHTVHFGYICDNEKLLDEVLVSIFKNPHSFTGEDVAEISCHGGVLLTNKIVSLIISKGARLAEPGEFTKRAFLNGKIDLSQAEAIVDLIYSETESARVSSIKQLEGSLSDYLTEIRSDILNVTSLIELELDFADEDVEFVKKKDLINQIQNIIIDLQNIIDTYISGKIIRDGVNLVIAGKPNSGKSSLFNTLLKSDRAIVSVTPGTTRDYIEERIIIDGVLYNLVDTAGLRKSDDEIENEGINRSFSKIEDADLILYLVDSSLSFEEIQTDIDYFYKKFNKSESLLVLTKNDLNDKKIPVEAIEISIYNDKLISYLKSKMAEKFSSAGNLLKSNTAILTNLRHKICLDKVTESLKNAVKSLENKLSGEFISIDLRNALNNIGEITGETTNDDILNNIFSKFCIGK